jgi:hypothetical protein
MQLRVSVPQQKNTLLAEVFVSHFHLAFVPDVKDSSTIKDFTRSLRGARGRRPHTDKSSTDGGSPTETDTPSVPAPGSRVLNGVHVGSMRLVVKGSMPLARPVGAAALKGPLHNEALFTDYNLCASFLSLGPELTLDPSIVRHLLDLQTIGDMFSFGSAFDAGVFAAPGQPSSKPVAAAPADGDKEEAVTNVSLRLVTLIQPGSIALHRLPDMAGTERRSPVPPTPFQATPNGTNGASTNGASGLRNFPESLRSSRQDSHSGPSVASHPHPSSLPRSPPKVFFSPESAFRTLSYGPEHRSLKPSPSPYVPSSRSPKLRAMERSTLQLDEKHLALDVGQTSSLFPSPTPGRPEEPSRMNATFFSDFDESMSMHFDSTWASADKEEANTKPPTRRVSKEFDKDGIDGDQNGSGETLLAKIPLPALSCTYTFDSASGTPIPVPPEEATPPKMHVAVVTVALAPVTLEPAVLTFVEQVSSELATVSFTHSGSGKPRADASTEESSTIEFASVTVTVRVEPTTVMLTCKPSRVVCELSISRPIDAVITWGPPSLPNMSLQCVNISLPLVTLCIGQAGVGDLLSFVLQHAHVQLGHVAGTNVNATPLTTALVTLSFVTVKIKAALLSQGSVLKRDWLDRLKRDPCVQKFNDTESVPTPAKLSSKAPSRSGLISLGVVKVDVDMGQIARVHTSLELRVKNVMARAFDSGSAQPEDQRTLKFSAESRGVILKPRGHEMVLESLGGKGLRSDGFKISFQRTPLPLFHGQHRPIARDESAVHGRKCALHCNRWKFQLLPLKVNLSTQQTELLEIESRGLTIIASDRYKHASGVSTNNGSSGAEGSEVNADLDEWRWSVVLDVSLDHLHVHVMSSQAFPYLIRLGTNVASFVTEHLMPAAPPVSSPVPKDLEALIAKDRRTLLEDLREKPISWVHAMAQGELRIKGRRLKLKFFAEAHTKDALLVTMINYKLALSSALTGQSKAGEPVDPEHLKLARRLVFDIGGHYKVAENGQRTWVATEVPKDKHDPTGINIYRAYYGTKSTFSPIFQIPTFVLEMKTVESAAPSIANQFETTWDDHITVAPDLSYRFLRDIVDRYLSEFDEAEAAANDAMPAKRKRKAAKAARVAAARWTGNEDREREQDLQLRVHNFDRDDDDDDDSDSDGKEGAQVGGEDITTGLHGKRIEADRTRFDLGDPQLNVLNKLGAGMSVEGLLKLLGVVDEDTSLESVIPQAVHAKLTVQVEELLKSAHALSLAVDAACDS